MEKIINRIKEIRKEKGISHEAMAFDLGISQVAYSKIEKNVNTITVKKLTPFSEWGSSSLRAPCTSGPLGAAREREHPGPCGPYVPIGRP